MRRAHQLLLVPLAVVALLAGPVSAETDGCTDPETGEMVLSEEAAWIHQAETKAGNLAGFGVTSFPTWDAEEPTTSVQGGAGGGYLANFAAFVDPTLAEQTGLTVEGTFSGCLDTMLLDLYAFLPTNRTGTSGNLEEADFTGLFSLTVDGEAILPPFEIDTNTVPNEAGSATYLIRVAITELHATMVDFGIDPTAEHTIRLNVASRYANTDNALFVYDTTEVPAGIVFNGAPTEDYPVLAAW
jgi:hypothetical protein